MKVAFLIVLSLLGLSLYSEAQTPLYEFLNLEPSLKVPEAINSERTAVIVHVPDEEVDFRKVGNWKALSENAHGAFVTMGIDAILYLNHYALGVSEKARNNYKDLFERRGFRNLIFLTQTRSGYEIVMCEFNRSPSFISREKPIFYHRGEQLYDVLLETGREVKRADFDVKNYLIPERPNFASGVSIVEKSLLKNYPGILRRTKLVVERFEKIQAPSNSDVAIQQKVAAFNESVDKKNATFEKLMQSYPYDFEFIDPLSDEDLLRKRYQFVLRSISGQASTIRQMLNYPYSETETDFVTTIPIMPDQTRAKPIPRETLVHKFYIRQNISKNIHVGVWDADVTWEEALENMIGNLIQEHRVD